MSLSTRFTRAGFALLLFGSFAAMLPNNGTALAAGGSCPNGSSSGTSYNTVQTAGYVGGGAAAATYLLGRNASGGIFPHRKKKHGASPYVAYPRAIPAPGAAPQPTAAASAPAATPVAQATPVSQGLQSYLASAQGQ